MPLWTFVAGALSALGRALLLAGLPRIVIRELLVPARTPTPPSPALPAGAPAGGTDLVRRAPSTTPSLDDLLAEEEHEVSVRRRRARRKRAHVSAAKTRRHSLRLAAKEDPLYVDATSKATRVKAAKLDLARASARMREALAQSGVLERPPPRHISSNKLRCVGRVCGLPDFSNNEEVAEVA